MRSTLESVSTIEFKEYTGIWVPYEITYADGSVWQGPFAFMSVFGAYAESIQLNADLSYVPLAWTDADTQMFKEEESGHFTFMTYDNKLLLTGGAWDMEFEITKYEGDELWLTYTGDIPLLGGAQTRYKLKREAH